MRFVAIHASRAHPRPGRRPPRGWHVPFRHFVGRSHAADRRDSDARCGCPPVRRSTDLHIFGKFDFRPQCFALRAKHCGRDREIYSLPGRPESTENTWVIDFPQLRGGALTVGVTVRIGAASPPLTATLSGLTIVGTNPTPAQIKAFANSIGATNQRFRKIMRQESSLSQFTSAGWPKFSADGRGGVGLCQVTIPTPTDDQIWNWKGGFKTEVQHRGQ